MAAHQCDVMTCSFSTKNRSNLVIHARTHTGEKPFRCNEKGCNYASAQSHDLVKHHMRKHTGEKPFRCNEKDCNYACVQSNDLVKHARTHTGEKPYRCNEKDCNYACANKNNLVIHARRTHTGEKPYCCNEKDCNYACVQSNDLVKHMRKHTGEKPFRCNEKDCNYASASSGPLVVHGRTHTGEKPYLCYFPSCLYASAYTRNLVAHINIHHNPDAQKNARKAIRTKAKEERLHAAMISADFSLHGRENYVNMKGCDLSDCPENFKKVDWVKFLRNGILLLLENDEFQHCAEEQSCEISRMTKVTEALRQGGNMCPIVWVRFNPDGFSIDGVRQKREKKVNFDDRVAELLRVVAAIESESVSASTPDMRVVYLFYNTEGTRVAPVAVAEYMDISGDGVKAFERCVVKI